MSVKKLVILDLNPDDITTLRLASASKTIELARAESEWWVTVADRPSVPKATHGNHAAASQSAVAEIDLPTQAVSELRSRHQRPAAAPREFWANRRARELVAKFASLEAVRDLGSLSRERVGELGFESPNKRLTVAYKAGEESFDVGGHATESSNVCLRRRSDGRVYLIRRDLLSDLEDGEESLLDRRLHGFAFPDIDRAVVSAGDRKRELIRRSVKGTTLWVDAAAPAAENELYGSWLRQAHQLDVRELLPSETRATPTTPVVTIEYYQGPAKQGQLELSWEPAAQGVGKRFRARSEHTLRWARVAGADAEAVVRDVDNVLPP